MQYKLNIEKSRNDFQACIEIVGKKKHLPCRVGSLSTGTGCCPPWPGCRRWASAWVSPPAG